MTAASMGTTEGDERTEKHTDAGDPSRTPDREKPRPENAAPDAVKDPSEKTDGMPGVPGQGKETDPGAG